MLPKAARAKQPGAKTALHGMAAAPRKLSNENARKKMILFLEKKNNFFQLIFPIFFSVRFLSNRISCVLKDCRQITGDHCNG